jgi:hypothetical protein
MLAGIAVVVHVLFVFWLVAGVVGRDVCYRQAERATDLSALRTMVGLGSRFELTMVRPATFAVLVAGLIAAWARGWPILGFLQGAAPNWVLAALLIYLSIIPVIVFVFIPRGRIYHAEQAVLGIYFAPSATAVPRTMRMRCDF